MGRKNNLGFIFSVLMVFALVVVFMVYTDIDFGFVDEYISLIPSIIIIFAGIYGVNETNGGMLVGAFLVLGIGFAYLTGELNTLGILIPEILTASLTLPYLQLIIVIFSGIIGAILSQN